MEELTAKQLRDKIAAGEIKSLDAVRDIFERIEKYEPLIGAYISTFKSQALEKAEEIDKKISIVVSLKQMFANSFYNCY